MAVQEEIEWPLDLKRDLATYAAPPKCCHFSVSSPGTCLAQRQATTPAQRHPHRLNKAADNGSDSVYSGFVDISLASEQEVRRAETLHPCVEALHLRVEALHSCVERMRSPICNPRTTRHGVLSCTF